MKKFGMLLVLALTFGASAAKADVIQLAHIFTNNCAAAQSEVRLLNGRNAGVDAYCEYGGFYAPNGLYYSYRLTTSISVPYAVYPGMAIELNRIDTNNCAAAESEIRLLDSVDARVETVCEYGAFVGSNGRVYSARLHTTVIVE
jgi:hypothetical protein